MCRQTKSTFNQVNAPMIENQQEHHQGFAPCLSLPKGEPTVSSSSFGLDVLSSSGSNSSSSSGNEGSSLSAETHSYVASSNQRLCGEETLKSSDKTDIEISEKHFIANQSFGSNAAQPVPSSSSVDEGAAVSAPPESPPSEESLSFSLASSSPSFGDESAALPSIRFC
jgi:hypothetical protein